MKVKALMVQDHYLKLVHRLPYQKNTTIMNVKSNKLALKISPKETNCSAF